MVEGAESGEQPLDCRVGGEIERMTFRARGEPLQSASSTRPPDRETARQIEPGHLELSSAELSEIDEILEDAITITGPTLEGLG